MTPQHLFVYGTLRRGVGHPLHAELLRWGSPAGKARVRGVLLDLGPYPALVPAGAEAGWVVGELYRLHRPERLLARLDAYEGCLPGEPFPEYRREALPVQDTGGVARSAWVYLYNRPTADRPTIASGDYLNPSGGRPA